jgi:hypothetical protein
VKRGVDLAVMVVGDIERKICRSEVSLFQSACRKFGCFEGAGVS